MVASKPRGVCPPRHLFSNLTRNPEDAQKTFDLLASKDKELFWIENASKRFRDGCNHFARHPERFIAFFDKHMK